MFAYTDALRTVHLTGCESVTVSSCLADNMAKGIHLDRGTTTERQINQGWGRRGGASSSYRLPMGQATLKHPRDALPWGSVHKEEAGTPHDAKSIVTYEFSQDGKLKQIVQCCVK